MQSAPSTESTGTMLMHPCLRLRYARALLTNSQDLCPRGMVLATNGAILPMAKIVRVGLMYPQSAVEILLTGIMQDCQKKNGAKDCRTTHAHRDCAEAKM